MKKFEQEFEETKRELLDGKHLEYDKEWSNLFSWLKENITVDNFVSQSMEESIKSGEFKEEMENIEVDFPGFFEVREGDVKAADDHLEALKRAEKEYREQSSQLGEILEQVNEELQELTKQSADTYAQSEIWREKTEAQEAELTSLLTQKDENMKRLLECYKNPEEVLSSGHIPSDLVQMKMSVAEKRLETCMTTFNSDGASKGAQNLSGKIEHFAENTVDLYEKLLENRVEVAGMESAIEMIDNFSELSLSTASSEMSEMNKMSEIFKAQIEDLTTECLVGKRCEVMREKQKIYTKAQQIKLKRAQDRMERLKEIDEYTGKFVDIGELLWILLQVDSKKMKHFLSILGKDEKSSFEDFLWHIDEESLHSVVSNFSIHPRKPAVQYVLDSNRNVKWMEKFSEFRKIEKTLKRLMLGPANTPILMAPQMSLKLHFLNTLGTQNESCLKEIKDRFIKEYLEPKGSNKLWTYRRSLWIWFLTQPKNIVMALEYATNEVHKKSSVRALPGIRNF